MWPSSLKRKLQQWKCYLPKEVDRALVEWHSDRGEDDQLKQEAKEQGDEAHQQGHGDHSLPCQLCPLSKSVAEGCPTLRCHK